MQRPRQVRHCTRGQMLTKFIPASRQRKGTIMTCSDISRIAALIALWLLAGCVYDEYSIELTPQDQLIQRQLTVTRHGEEDDEFPPEKLAAIRQLYPKEVPTDVEGGHAFVGEFSNTMPDDVGGAGEYVTFDTRMGSCSVYIERFRGNDAPAERIQHAFAAADELTDILIGWLETELADCADLPKLMAFLDKDIRGDLKDLAVYAFMLSSTSSAQWAQDDSGEKLQQEVLARAVQYVIERGYFLPEEAAAVLRMVTEERDPDSGVLAVEPFIIQVLRRKADLKDEDTVAALQALLADWPSLRESLEVYISKNFQRQVQQWLDRHAEQVKAQAEVQPPEDTERPELLGVLSDDLQAIFALEIDFGGLDDVAKVVLKDITEPIATNGLWDAEAMTVSWSNSINDSKLPAVCYAMWAEPDADFQMQHFGKVLLAGGDLQSYCLWRKSLTDGEAAEWDAMIARFEPGDEESLAMLLAFRFSHEPAIDEGTPQDANGQPYTYASTAIQMLAGKLSAEEAANRIDDTIDSPAD